MRGRKTPAVAFVARLIKNSSRPGFLDILAQTPLTKHERELVTAYTDGMLYKELADRYHVTTSTIYARKRKAYEKICCFYRKTL